jgi:hypothetical protein
MKTTGNYRTLDQLVPLPNRAVLTSAGDKTVLVKAVRAGGSMDYQIRMPPEAEKWIAGLGKRVLGRAAEPGRISEQLVPLSRVRRAGADVAMWRKRL